ncbi:MAG TPA: hypothetical protein VD766_04850 [Solirubrobacterales bacterium]|nr:hypothetical protein [Solirubrobacterales bacterium]
MLLAALGVFAGGVGIAAAAVPTGNLIKNSGGETNPASVDGNDNIDIPLWDDRGMFTVVEYGAPGFPTEAQAAMIGGGNDLFAGGPSGGQNVAVQRSVLPARAFADVDSGAVNARLSGYLGGFASQGDNMVVQALFKSAEDTTLGQVKIGPVTPEQREGVTTLLPRARTAGVPIGTRSILFRQVATRLSGTYNDGYADNLNLRLTIPD